VRIAAGFMHSCVLAEDGRVFAFGSCDGIPAAGQQGTPQLLQEGALAAGTTVCALTTGCNATHAAFVEGPPPAAPGFEIEVPACRQFLAWLRRRVLLLCLLRAAQRGRAGGGEAAQPKRLHSSSGDGAAAATAPATAAAGGEGAGGAAAAGDGGGVGARGAAAAGEEDEEGGGDEGAADDGEVLLRLASLPDELWKGPLIFQFL
jgi:hypothetical protein